MRIAVINSGPEPLPAAFGLLPHEFSELDAQLFVTALSQSAFDVVLVNALSNPGQARAICQKVSALANWPVLLLAPEAALVAITPEWPLTDFVLPSTSLPELDLRLRLIAGQRSTNHAPVQSGALTIDENSFTASAGGRKLDLTFKEFELLLHLASNPERVFTREQLLSEVWGSDYYGGTRTVDVHIRRLRAKLGDLEGLIGTVRGVGYGFTPTDA